MKKLWLVAFILFISTINLFAGVVERSPYDQKWEIMVTNCQGQTTIYYECVITNQGEYVVTFIPNSGNIPTGNGKTIKVFKNDCTSIVMQEQ